MEHLNCKSCGYKQYDEDCIEVFKQRYPDMEAHDIPYKCGACMDNEVVTCIHCNHTMEWEGNDEVTGAVPYCCEKCGEIFCTACVPISDEDVYVLCKNCKNKKEE